MKHPVRFTFFSGALAAVGMISAILLGVNFIVVQKETRVLSLYSWYAEPQITNIDGEQTTTFHAGDSFIINYYVERQPLKCWGTYFDVINGPVTYQFPAQRTQILVDKVTRVELPLLKVLPDPLPPGQYTWKQITYPTCDGIELKPFVMDSGIVITILPK